MDHMCPLLPNRLFIWPERRGMAGRQIQGKIVLHSAQHAAFVSGSFHLPPFKWRRWNWHCTSKMLIKQTHFSSTAKANKRASTSPHSSQNDSATQQQWMRPALFRDRQPRAILLKISTSDVEGKTGVLSAFVGSGLIRRVSLSSHLLDSISSSVTSADYVSSKQPATWRHRSAIIVREWQRA